jgi:selenocysteine-specific translation elongation factor
MVKKHLHQQVLLRRCMTVLNVAMVGSDELARSIAKASDQRDVHTYVHKEMTENGTKILSIIRPAKYPERLRPFLNALSTSRAGLLEVESIDATLGEALVAFASAGIHEGIAVIAPKGGQWMDEDQVKALFTQAGLGQWTFETNDGILLRERLYAILSRMESTLEAVKEHPLVVPIDQDFNVKGIGLVAIGYVQSGTIRVHDQVTLLPAHGSGDVKSLQVMDDDVEFASAGDRVGIALRNAKEDHLNGDTMIVHPEINDKRTGKIVPLALVAHKVSNVRLQRSPFQKKQLETGDVVHASVDLQFVVGRIQDCNGDEFVVEWEHPLYIRGQDAPSVLLAQLDSKPRIMGSCTIELKQ